MRIAKDGSGPGGNANVVGEVVSWSIAVTNAGNAAVSNVTVTDPTVSNLTFTGGDTDSDGKLDVGETWHYTASQQVTQANLDAGGNITDVATAQDRKSVEEGEGA